MKKLLAVVVCVGLLSNSLNAISPLRTWQCRPTNPRPNCSQAEKDAAKSVFKKATAATLGTLAAILTALGITATVYQLTKEKEAATKPMTERERIEAAMQLGRQMQEELPTQPTPEEVKAQARGQLQEKLEETEARIRRLRGQ